MAERVLLVDDNLTNLQVLYQALEEEGYELLVAQSGEEALASAGEAQPAVVLLDINMPGGIDGYEVCRRLKADPATRESIVVFLSAKGELDDKLEGFEAGAVDYISKPFEFEEVVARVKGHAETFRRERSMEREIESLVAELGRGFLELDESAIRELTDKGENDRVEFKSTLRHNLHTDKADKRIENACLKTLAAFLNSEGGTLLVGVDDEGKALGLDADRFDNEDRLLLHLTRLIVAVLGGEQVPLIRASIHSVDEKRVLAVQCGRSREPVFFRRDSDEYFYVRVGPSTQALGPSELLSYVERRRRESAS